MLQNLTFRRIDGTLVGQVNGLPYHIIQSDPLWPVAQAVAANMGDELPFEPAPPPPPPPPPPVTDVSFWQFMMAAWKMGFIAYEEALAAVRSRTMPPAFVTALAGLPEAAWLEAELKFAGITRMLRSDPLFARVVAANIATDEQIDGVFALAATVT